MKRRERVAAVVLAAGAASRFGGPKALARLEGRPILEHVLEAVRPLGFDEVVVVLGHAADAIETGIAWQGERRVRNPDPGRGLSSSLRVGLAALGPGTDAALVLLGDQPRVRADVIGALLDRLGDDDRPIVVPRYAGGSGPNPALLRRPAWGLADELRGDRGMGPLIARRPELVRAVAVTGDNPDVDTEADLRELAGRRADPAPGATGARADEAAAAEAAWGDQVRANRDQVDRVREVPDAPDFYAPVSSLFRADPRRTDEPILDLLRTLVHPGETWLDIGAGAGRYALPLALVAAEVIAVDQSAGMLAALREDMATYGISNVRLLDGRWPPDEELAARLGPLPCTDAALIAHVGYDIEPIGPFLDAMEGAARRMCVAVLMERQPSSVADVCWPPVHGEARVPLPALPEFVALLRARGRRPKVTIVDRDPRRFDSLEDLEGFLRRQLWVAEGSEKDGRFRRVLAELVEEEDGRFGLRGHRPLPVGIVTWKLRP